MIAPIESAGQGALWLLVGLPAVVGAALCLAGRRLDRAAVPVALATATAGVGLAVAVAVGRPVVSAPFVADTPFGLAVDPLSALVVGTVTTITLLVLVFAAADVTSSRARFFGLMLLFAAAVAVTATATTLPALLLAWEVMGATSYALIGFWWHDDTRVAAGATAFLTTPAPPTWGCTPRPRRRWPAVPGSRSPISPRPARDGAMSSPPGCSSPHSVRQRRCPSPSGCPGPWRGRAR